MTNVVEFFSLNDDQVLTLIKEIVRENGFILSKHAKKKNEREKSS
jgi:hypothetical protein